jgi:arylsulfatase A-like enzyme
MLLLLAAEVLLGVSAATPRGRPAILMMLADDWGSYDASWRMKELGRTPDILTPHIDELSAGGVRFSNYYVQPICTPTRSVLMSGRYSIHTGCEHILFGASEPSCLPTEFPIMPEAFKKIGYQTHMAGCAPPSPPAPLHPCTRVGADQILRCPCRDTASGTLGTTTTPAPRGRVGSTLISGTSTGSRATTLTGWGLTWISTSAQTTPTRGNRQALRTAAAWRRQRRV